MRKWSHLKPNIHFGGHLFYEDLESTLEEWEDQIDAEGWHEIPDPLPDCQHDCILPVRVKGRDKGAPEWGQYEILKNGVWEELP